MSERNLTDDDIEALALQIQPLIFSLFARLVTQNNTVFTTILTRSATAADWVFYNPVLGDGEQGFEKPLIAGQRGAVKIGDGVRAWNSLPYYIYPAGSTPPVLSDIFFSLDYAVTPVYSLPASGEVILRRKDGGAGIIEIVPSVGGQTVLKGASTILPMQDEFIHLIFNPLENDWNKIG